MSEKAQIIQVPNTLRAKVGGKMGALDQAAIAKAEAAIADLSSNFGEWLLDEVKKIEAAQAEIKASGFTPANADKLYFHCHDLKGLGTTYGYPLVTRIAGSLCKMMDDEAIRLQAPRVLIDAHLDAIRAAVRDSIKEDTHPVGKILADTLEARVKEHLNAIGHKE
ncbi:Hpt domain-containing protein [Asticcacaulis sp. ZE23SCel15]|uniref:Hpt domain-containing protein n=1 Tax=Asticcacaulis sp. ZE23SCel15 TaxID=3059027 RepID=UPI002660014C|nr:Hpt domain-containing protein [Asticcacaulis sp. ZE23SCel15]WKL56246.1 Hpt domain-containing protein [Asticcacaulis sp. ZE23SCel15]